MGRIPLKGKILFSCFQYLEHILSLEGSLVKDIFENMNQSYPWIVRIKASLQNLGFSFLINNMSNLKSYLNN